MANQQLLDYVRAELGKGVGREAIKAALLSQGWQERDIDEAFIVEAGGTSAAVSVALPSGGALLREAWALFARRLPTLAGIIAIPTVIGYLAAFSSAYLESVQVQQAAAVAPAAYIVAFIVGILIMVFLSLWAQVALLYAIKDADEGIGIGEAFKRGWRAIGSYLWTSFLVSFVTFGGFVLAVIPGIVFSVWFIFAVFIFIAEGERGMHALLKSREYVRGNWWGVFARLLVVFAVAFIPGVVIGFFSNFVPLADLVGNIILTIFLGPLVSVYLFTLYKHLRAARGAAAFVPTGGQKATFITIGVVGLLAIPLILGSVVWVSLNTARTNAQEARHRADLSSLRVSLELYRDTKGQYPDTLETLLPEYVSTLPTEYRYDTSGADYTLCVGPEEVSGNCVSSR